MKDLRDTDGQRRSTTGTGQNSVFTDVFRDSGQLLRRDRKSPAGHGLRNGYHVTAYHRSRAVHGEVHARLDHRSGNHRHDGHEGLHQHAAVTDVTGVLLVIQQFGRRARRDQCVETRHCTAGNGDEQEREQCALPDRACAVGELGQGRHFQLGRQNQDADRECQNGADFQEGRQVVTGRKQQPDRQHGRYKAITDQHPVICTPVNVNIGPQVGSAATMPPTQMEPSNRMTPTMEISPMRPGRM